MRSLPVAQSVEKMTMVTVSSTVLGSRTDLLRLEGDALVAAGGHPTANLKACHLIRIVGFSSGCKTRCITCFSVG